VAIKSDHRGKGREDRMVRIIIRLENGALVRRLVHATPYEPVAIDAEHGVLEFKIPFRRVLPVLNRLSESGVGWFLAHLVPCR
jgi:hypothetical protein